MATITIDRSEKVDADRRSISTRYLLSDSHFTTTEYDEGYQPALEISTSHDKDRKRYVTMVSRIRVGDRMVRWVMELRDEDPCPIRSVASHAARYSAKEMRSLHDDYIAQIDALSADQHEELMLWASRAKG